MKNKEDVDQKRKRWDLIQSQDPVLADFLVKINQAFGKPTGLSVEFKSGERFSSSSLSYKFNHDEELG